MQVRAGRVLVAASWPRFRITSLTTKFSAIRNSPYLPHYRVRRYVQGFFTLLSSYLCEAQMPTATRPRVLNVLYFPGSCGSLVAIVLADESVGGETSHLGSLEFGSGVKGHKDHYAELEEPLQLV
jgi:hypothetical protein